jgi:hypothetical protein
VGATPQRRFLEAYSGQSLDELISLETNYRVDSLVLAIEQALLGRSELNEYERIVLAVEALEREVNNGGFDQFFTNSSHEFAPILAESLRRIGCPKTASIAQRAVDAAVDKEDEAREEALSECDSAYFAGEEEPIADKLFAFVKSNREFIRVGK